MLANTCSPLIAATLPDFNSSSLRRATAAQATAWDSSGGFNVCSKQSTKCARFHGQRNRLVQQYTRFHIILLTISKNSKQQKGPGSLFRNTVHLPFSSISALRRIRQGSIAKNGDRPRFSQPRASFIFRLIRYPQQTRWGVFWCLRAPIKQKQPNRRSGISPTSPGKKGAFSEKLFRVFEQPPQPH